MYGTLYSNLLSGRETTEIPPLLYIDRIPESRSLVQYWGSIMRLVNASGQQ